MVRVIAGTMAHIVAIYLFCSGGNFMAVPISVIVALVFLTYFGARLGTESRKRAKALNKLELTLAKEQELESIGHQAAAAVHSLGTPLSTITVIAK